MCIDSATFTTKKITRCFIFHVSKCRYCAQAGETLQSLADSFYTGLVCVGVSCCENGWALAGECRSDRADELMHCCDADWLQIWAANTHLTNPHDFKLYQLVNLGAMYPAREADTLADLAHRFRSDLRSLRVSASPFVFASLPHLPPSFALPFLPGNLRICD